MQTILEFIVAYWYIVLPVVLVLVGLLVVLARRGILRKISVAGFELDLNDLGGRGGQSTEHFAQSDSTEFVSLFTELARKACRVVLIGTGINVLHRDPVFINLLERATSGSCELEIYLANPYSPNIETRLIEEEAGTLKPPVGREGLIKRLDSLLAEQRKYGRPHNLTVRLFNNYPTFAMFIVDSHYFFYPYGFAMLGNLSPVMHYRKTDDEHKPIIEFLERQYQRIKGASVDAQLIADIQAGRKQDNQGLVPFAVYLIPDGAHPFYRFGSEVLGYDVRESRPLLSPWAAHVGRASEFGFHLTVADALYLPSARLLELAAREIEYVVQSLPPFKLDFSLRAPYPNNHTISLLCKEESGALEALHHEMVARVYRHAVGSNYSLGLAPSDRDGSHLRDQLMTRRYHAPYILSAFTPHFTLLNAVPADKMTEVSQSLRQAMAQAALPKQVEIKTVALMTRPNPDRPWMIHQEFRLQ